MCRSACEPNLTKVFRKHYIANDRPSRRSEKIAERHSLEAWDEWLRDNSLYGGSDRN